MKKLISVLSCLCILLSHSYYSYAVESTQLKDENYSYEYYNKDTGEYFVWEGTNPNSRSNVVGTFRFKIRYNLSADKNFFFKTDKVRVEKVRNAMKDLEIDGLIVYSPYNLRYLANFTGTTGFSLITLNEAYFVNFENVKTSCCKKHRFSVSVRKYGVTNNYAEFTAPILSTTSRKLGGGFALSPTPYRIDITNGDELPLNVYLCGSGNLSNY